MNPTAPLLLLLLTACVASNPLQKNIWVFARTIMCCQPDVNPLRYNNYGCYCGIGGSGTPKDEVDKCCKVHDDCYEKARKTPGCNSFVQLPYFIPYEFTCSDKQVTCSADNGKCEANVCNCDRAVAHCFAKAKYNPENKNLQHSLHCRK